MRLSTSVLRPISSGKETIRSQTPTMLQRPEPEKALRGPPDGTARLNACRDAIQSLCSALLSLTTLNFVIEKGSKLSDTTAAHLWRHLLDS